ncbi:MAG: class I adenylate-forming enzyme family protein [Eubacteriales bacterium]|nr:class I adenylate-forming enzyme family protein [Eubacteriales bacterium]
MEEKKFTGYPSIDKPWLKYYSEEALRVELPAGSMYDYVFRRNANHPDDIALIYYGNKINYRTLFEKIDRCASSFSHLGIKKGDIVTVQAIAVPQLVTVLYALNKLGACCNMLMPDARASDVESAMGRTQSKLFIVVDKLLASYELEFSDAFDRSILLINVAEEMGFPAKFLAKRKAICTLRNGRLSTLSWKKFLTLPVSEYTTNHDSDIPAFMVRTGGTTGISKEVVLTNQNFNSVAEAMFCTDMCHGWNRTHTCVNLLPPFIAFGIASSLHNPLSYGITSIIELDISPHSVGKLFAKYHPNYIIAGTVQAEQMMKDLRLQKIDMSSLELVSIGGEAISKKFEQEFNVFLKAHNCKAQLTKGYGLTETSAAVIAETIYANKTGSVGIPMPFCNIKIVDMDSGEELPYNNEGEIFISSPGLMREYFKNPAATDEVIAEQDGVRWLRTGDVGSVSSDGILTITGRIKRMIVCFENDIYHKVFPKLLEEKLETIEGISEAAIVGVADEATVHRLVAFVVMAHGYDANALKEHIMSFSAIYFESYERLCETYVVDALPRTLIGKVDFRALEHMAAKEEMSND